MELLLRDPARSAAALEGGNAVLLADRVRPDQVVHGDRRRSWTALRYGSDGLPAVHCVARCQARMPSVPGQFRSAPQTWDGLRLSQPALKVDGSMAVYLKRKF